MENCIDKESTYKVIADQDSRLEFTQGLKKCHLRIVKK